MTDPIYLQAWERARADRFVSDSKRVMLGGTQGADSLSPLVTPEQIEVIDDAPLRRAAYGMFPALGVVEPWFTDLTFGNNWVGDASGAAPKAGVMLDPFGFVHWRGWALKTSGTAVNGEEICRFPAKYAPKLPKSYPCATNSGIILIGVYPGSDFGVLVWRTTGGFTGGYGYVYLDNLQPYDTRE